MSKYHHTTKDAQYKATELDADALGADQAKF